MGLELIKFSVMNNMRVISKFVLACTLGATLLLQSCSGGYQGGGDLVGVPDRVGWTQSVPFGMIVCPSGTFHMGQADEDVPNTLINQNRQVTIGGFYMDETEITNNEYRQFME